ncbi:MAG: sulfotransferase [Alphaproteobacteria bacterium]|nr:sulfotransferase [Alphaproteobacteria bacterium]
MLPALIHVGFPRTGTTAMQRELEEFAGNAVFLGRFTSRDSAGLHWKSGGLQSLMEAVNRATNPFSARLVEEAQKEITATAKKSDAIWLIGSDERMCKPPRHRKSDWRRDQARSLRQVFPHAHILMTVRRQTDLLVSLYKRDLTRVKLEHRVSKFRDWLAEGGGSEFAPWRERFDFFSYYEAFADVFGSQYVHVVPYEIYAKDPDELSTVFRKCFPTASTRVSLKRIVNRERPHSGERAALLKTVSDKSRRAIEEAFADSNSKLAKYAEPRIVRLGYVF